MIALAIIYILLFALTLISGLNANKINYENKREGALLGIGASILKQKNKWLRSLHLFLTTFSRALIWFITLPLGFFYVIRAAIKKNEFTKVHMVVHDVLYIHSEFFVIVLMVMNILSFYATINLHIPMALSKYFAWISILYCLCLNLTYLFFRITGLVEKLKKSIFNIVGIYLTVVLAMIIIYILSYSIIINGTTQNPVILKNIVFDFIAINNIWLWLAGKTDQLTIFEIFMSLNGSVFSISVLTSIKSIFTAKRNDEDYLSRIGCQLALGKFIAAKKVLKKISKVNEKNILRCDAIIDLATNKIENAISKQSSALNFFKGSKYFDEIVYLMLMDKFESHNIDKNSIRNLFYRITSQEIHPLIFISFMQTIEQIEGKGYILKFFSDNKIYSSLSETNSTYKFITQMEGRKEQKFEDEQLKKNAFQQNSNLVINLTEAKPMDLLLKYMLLIIFLLKSKKYPKIEENLLRESREVITKISNHLNEMDKSEFMFTLVYSGFIKNVLVFGGFKKLDTLLNNLEYEIEELLNLEINESLKMEFNDYIEYSKNLSKSAYKKL